MALACSSAGEIIDYFPDYSEPGAAPKRSEAKRESNTTNQPYVVRSQKAFQTGGQLRDQASILASAALATVPEIMACYASDHYAG